MSFVVLDIETDGFFGPMDRLGVGGPNRVFTLPWNADTRNFVRPFLEGEGMKVGHNFLAFDEPHLRKNGIKLRGPFHDTMLCGHLIEADMPKALRSMVPLYCDVRPWKHLSDSEPEKYNALDVINTRSLFLVQREILEHDSMASYFDNTIMPGVPVLCGQTEMGLTVDLDERERLRLGLQGYLSEAYQTWGGLTNVNPKSPAALCRLFYGTLGLPVQRDKDSGRPSTDEDALEALRAVAPDAGDLISALLEIRRTEASFKKYIDMPGAAQGRVHARFLPGQKDNVSDSTGKGAATTGRLGASPNLQNVPGEWKHKGRRVGEQEAQRLLKEGAKVLPPMRRMFVPRRKGDVFLEADYSQLQLRIIQAVSGCQDLARALAGDLHEVTRAAVERESGAPVSRVLAKNYSYLTWFGGKERGLVNFFRGKGIPITTQQARAGQRGIAKAYPRAWRWKEEVERRVALEGWLREPFGRKRHFYGGGRDVTEGVVFIPQGCEASILWDQLPRQAELANANGGFFPLTVHDSYLHEVPGEHVAEYAALLRSTMQREYSQVAPGWSVPVDLKVGKNWGSMEKIIDQAKQAA